MSSPALSHRSEEDEAKPPFRLQIFYKNGTLLRPDDFSSRNPPPYATVYVHPTATLENLTTQLAISAPDVVPHPAIGTRVVYQLVYPDVRIPPHGSRPKYLVKDLGSVVIGGVGPWALQPALPEDDPGYAAALETLGIEREKEESKTLEDAKFVVGDFVSAAILAPLADGSVASEGSAKREQRDRERDRDWGRDRGRRDRDGRPGGPGGGGGGAAIFPVGEWRRGERIPEGPRRGRGRRF